MFNDEDSDAGEQLNINAGYAKSYNSFRQKEEFNKLKTKYGQHLRNLESSEEQSDSTSEDDEDGTLTEQVEKDFYKTLACLKNKDPKIYDGKVEFFKKSDEDPNENDANGNSKKRKKEKKLFLRDYERQIVLERGGKLSDSEDEETFHSKKRESRAPTYIEEQRALKESISKVLADEDEDEDDEKSALLKPKVKTEDDKLREEEAYKEWLKGRPTEIDNGEKEALKPLRDFWTDPNLDPKEKFLRDYVLNKKFLDKDAPDNHDYDHIAHDSDDNLSEDEKNIEKQEEFEHKYNFRFEEPDQEFIKRYPRSIENSLRKPDTKRSQKRAEVKQRKEEEKIRKKEELKQLKAIKRKEIADKIAMLKDITGNDDIQFDTKDLEGDFDPEEYDRKMQKMFNDEYYADPEDDVKPEFPDIDEELGIERTWDDYDPNNEIFVPDKYDKNTEDVHCEDAEFNMDADYDPSKALQSELIDASRKKKKRRRSKFAEIMAKEKPKFDANVHSSYKDYIEQYYALDYEDMIDDIPCRFKYRKVVPNDYGLSVEEILTAEDHELNKWCSLKKALEHKPESMEHYEVRAYQQKARNEEYKKKVFRSLYAPKEEPPQDPEIAIAASNSNDETAKRKRKKKKKKKEPNSGNSTVEVTKSEAEIISNAETLGNDNNAKSTDVSEKKKKKKKQEANNENSTVEATKSEAEIISNTETPANDNNVESKDVSEKKKKKKVKTVAEDSPKLNETQELPKSDDIISKKSKKRKANANERVQESGVEKIEEPREKKSKSSIAVDNVEENSKILTKKSNENKQKTKKQTDVTKQNSEIIGKVANANGEDNNKKIKEKNKKRSHGTTDGKKKFKKPIKQETDQVAQLSSERLKAYGLNPKKFRNKLKYGKQK